MSDDLRIGYVVKRYPRYSETFIVNELLAHEAAGLDVEIFALRQSNDTHFQDLIARVRAPVHYLPYAALRADQLWRELVRARTELSDLVGGLEAAWDADVSELYQALELAREVRARGLCHLHAHFATSATVVARIAARLAGISFSFTAHAKDIFHEEVDPAQLSQKMRDAAAVITVSDFNERHLRASDATSADRVVRIYNGLNLESFRFEAPGNRANRILGVGRLVEKKGFGDLVEACAVLAESGRDFDCRLIGEGPLEPELRARIEELGLGSRVELTGPLPQNLVRAEIREAAVFAAPCVVGTDGNRDGLPTTLLEAMALGTPCIATDVTGIPEILRDGETGLAVPQHDPKAIARAAARLLDDPDERVRLAQGARRLIEANFDIARNTASQREIFRTGARGARVAERVAS